MSANRLLNGLEFLAERAGAAHGGQAPLHVAPVPPEVLRDDSVEQVPRLGGQRLLLNEDLTEALARHSLVQIDRAEHGPRLRMLETIREFVAERLGARPDVTEVARRHASYYRALAERADRPLRGGGQGDTGSVNGCNRRGEPTNLACR